MTSTRLALATLLAAGALVAGGCGGGGEESATETETTTGTATETVNGAGGALLGSVGPGFEISVTTATRQAVDTLAPGSYALDVSDKSSAHNFHLTGPGGVDVSTSVGGSGEESFRVELEPGTYSFVCDPHASTMNGSFEVSP
jgi:plastocyanin